MRFYNEHEGGGLDLVQLVLLDLKTQTDAFSPSTLKRWKTLIVLIANAYICPEPRRFETYLCGQGKRRENGMEWLLLSEHLLTVGENQRSVIALVIIHRREERAFFIGCYERAAMLIIKMEAVN